MSNSNPTLEEILEAVNQLECGISTTLYEEGLGFIVSTQRGQHSIKFLGVTLWNADWDERPYIKDQDGEVILDEEGEESREDLTEYLLDKIEKIAEEYGW